MKCVLPASQGPVDPLPPRGTSIVCMGKIKMRDYNEDYLIPCSPPPPPHPQCDPIPPRGTSIVYIWARLKWEIKWWVHKRHRMVLMMNLIPWRHPPPPQYVLPTPQWPVDPPPPRGTSIVCMGKIKQNMKWRLHKRQDGADDEPNTMHPTLPCVLPAPQGPVDSL